VSACPLPPRIAQLLDSPAASRSLRFDKGVGTYDADWKFGSEGKRKFLREFTTLPPVDLLRPFLARRSRALSGRPGDHHIELISQTRVVVGLGLPQPIETGFLLDRLTGCPYLPGSSVKGVLRAAARRVAAGELTLKGDPGTDIGFFRENLDRLFGPALGGNADAAKGELVFFDAFPTRWPTLEVDVLTPHQGDYYVGGSDSVPGDWHDPVPVPFLTVAPGTCFVFHFRCRNLLTAETDLSVVERLLRGALDELGIGGKTGAGYGFFGTEAPPKPHLVEQPGSGPRQVPPGTQQRREERPRKAAKPPKVIDTLWKGQTIELVRGVPTAYRGKQTAQGRLDEVEPDLRKVLRARNRIHADLRAVTGVGGSLRITSIESWTLV
jgi:CRISPR-associated protein Cmr6